MQMDRLQDGLAEAVAAVENAKNTVRSDLAMDIRSLQKPLKDQYRSDPNTSQITLRAKGGQTDVPVACSVDIGRAIYQAEAHKGVGGAGAGACSGDLLLGALAACAQITCQMVAAAMGIPTERIEVTVEGVLDLRGTLGISKDVPVGFESIRLHFDVSAPTAAPEQLRALQEKTEQYCVVMQTLVRPPSLQTKWAGED
ncbi:MAG: OsmC family protein [Candidatus Sulfotelmatobacter sp.]